MIKPTKMAKTPTNNTKEDISMDYIEDCFNNPSLTKEDIPLKDYIENCYNNPDSVKGTIELIKLVKQVHPTIVYEILRDVIKFHKCQMISKCKQQNTKVYQEIQDIYMNAKKSYQHDHTMATNLDIDKAVTKAYGITLRMIGNHIYTQDKELNTICCAINKIEEHLGIDVTDFSEIIGEVNNDTKCEDVQRN